MHPLLLSIPELQFTIRSYAAMVVLAVLVGWWVALRSTERLAGIRRARTASVLLALTAAAFVGARLHYVGTHWAEFATRPMDAFIVWKGGLHAGGGVLALFMSSVLLFRLLRVNAGQFADALAPAAGVALAIVRLGCFLKGCCFGTVCDAPWCVAFPKTSYLFLLHGEAGLVGPGAVRTAAVHPLQLYFAAAALGIAALSLWLHSRRQYDGQVALIALFTYAASSGVLELFRADYPGRVYWAGVPQLTWTAMALAAFFGALLPIAGYGHRRVAEAAVKLQNQRLRPA